MEQEILEKVKILLGITDDIQDELLMIYIKDLIARVLADINQDTIPDGLLPILPVMVTDYYSNVAGGEIKSISEGDKSVSFGLTETFKKSNILSNYDSILGRFRRITWNVG